MSKLNYRLGIVADLSPNGSIHQQTFIRAVEMAADQLQLEQSGVELIWENDYATYEGGHQSAQILVQKGVDAVIGHYASAAAKGALPYYEKKQIPLLLPAASADFLTSEFNSAFRLCGRDSDLVDLICQTLLDQNIKELYIGNDHSIHGKALSENIIEKLRPHQQLRLTYDVANTEHIVYVGSYTNSVNFAKGLQARTSRPKKIYFADDLVHPNLPKDLKGIPQQIFVFGYENARDCIPATNFVQNYHQQWGEDPNTYFLETYAAMQVIQQVFESAAGGTALLKTLALETYSTVLGPFKFTKQGESGFKRFSLWTLQDGTLRSAKSKVLSS